MGLISRLPTLISSSFPYYALMLKFLLNNFTQTNYLPLFHNLTSPLLWHSLISVIQPSQFSCYCTNCIRIISQIYCFKQSIFQGICSNKTPNGCFQCIYNIATAFYFIFTTFRKLVFANSGLLSRHIFAVNPNKATFSKSASSAYGIHFKSSL